MRNAFDGVYQTGLQFIQEVLMGDNGDERDDDQGGTVIETEVTGDRTQSGWFQE